MFQTNLLWQNDDRWANDPLGYGPQTIKEWGCLTTSLTMVVNGCGYNETPESLSKKMVNIGAFSGAAINAYRIGNAFPGVALARLTDCESTPAPLSDIDGELSNDKPVVVRVDQSPAPGIQDHWVVLYAKDGSDYLMWDPWHYQGDAPGKALRLTDRYKNSGSTPAEAITSVIFFTISGKPAAGTAAPAPAAQTSSPAPAPAAKVSVPADAVKLTPTVDQLAFRAASDVTGALLGRFPLGTTLLSLESRSDTLAKVGQMNQWLHAQAPDGTQGYTAAWYLSSPDAPAAAAPSSSASSSGFTVKVTEDALAFRSQPVIADNTLISRFPLGTQLTVIGPDGAQKVGQMNQWLHVQAADGTQGYVAAWYVSR